MPSVDNGDGTFKTEGTDFHNEKQVKAMLARGALGKIKWIDCGNKYLGIKMNWIVFVLATFITWGFAFWSMFDEEAGTKFGGAKTWVSQNFTWLYISTSAVLVHHDCDPCARARETATRASDATRDYHLIYIYPQRAPMPLFLSL